MNRSIVDAFGRQIKIELIACYLYHQMAHWFLGRELPGFANWMRNQAQEEFGHALVFHSHLTTRKQRADIGAVAAAKYDFTSAASCFSHFIAHEKKASAHLALILDLAIIHRDGEVAEILEWFETENDAREEEVDTILARLKMTGGERCPVLLNLDEDLAEREFRLPDPLLKETKPLEREPRRRPAFAKAPARPGRQALAHSASGA